MGSDETPAPGTSPEPGGTSAAGAAPGGTPLKEVLRIVAVAALVGTAVIHFAYAPGHFDEATSHGVFFVAVAWTQLAAAAALWRWRGRSEPWLAAVALSAGVAGVWLVTRTAGLPGEDAEGIAFADGLATGLELVTVLAGLAALAALAARPVPRLNPAVGTAAALVLVGAVSFSLNPSAGHDHGEDDGHDHEDAELVSEGSAEGADGHGGHDHGEGEVADVARDDRCDIRFNTATFNETSDPGEPHSHDDTGEGVDFTLEEWAEVFVQPDHPLGNGIPRDVVVSFIQDNPNLESGILSGGIAHTLEPDPWMPMTDHDECTQLGEELEQSREVVARYPTAADAIDDGYSLVTPYYPGIAAHYMNFSLVDEEFDVSNPEMILFDGDGPNANIVGLSHYIVKDGDEPPEDGFTGPNDHYHRHIGLCIADGVVVGGTTTSEEECESMGGRKSGGTGGWMSHVWVVPGCESDWGMFSGANPNLVVREMDNTADTETGCGTGRSLDGELALDDGGHGPGV